MTALRTNCKSGVVLPVVLVLVFCGFIIAAMLAIHAGRSLVLTRRSLEYQRASVLADSGIGYGLMYVKNEISKLGWASFLRKYPVGEKVTLVMDNRSSTASNVTIPDYDCEYKNGVCLKVADNSMTSSTSEKGKIKVLVYSISMNKASGIASAVQETISLSISQLGDYAAFYEYDLEAWPGENMTFVGKVHSNGDLWIGADKLMKFERNVTAAGNFHARRKPDSSYGDEISAPYITQSGRVQFRIGNDEDYEGEKPAKYADVINEAKNKKRMDYTGIGADKWYSESMSYYGGAIKTAQAKLSAPISVADDPHTIIERPDTNRIDDQAPKGSSEDTESVKFSNKACLIIRVDADGGLHLYDRKHNEIENPESYMQPATSVSKASTTTGQYNVQRGTYSYTDDTGREKSEQLPAYQVNNVIYDRREDMPMQPVDIYVDEILKNDKLKSYLYPADITEEETAEAGVLYVTRDTPKGYENASESKSVKESELPALEKEGWEQESEPTEEPLYTVKQNGTTTYSYYYTDTRRQKQYHTETTYRGTSYSERVASGRTTTTRTYYLDSTKTTTTSPKIIATGLTDAEATEKMKGHSDYTKEAEGTSTTMYHMRKVSYIPTQACVRLRNANNLKDSKGNKCDLSVATDLPLYVEGCFNTDGQKGRSGDTDFSNRSSALVAADAVTMLSSKWDDSKRTPNWAGWNERTGMTSVRPTENLDSREAIETTFNGILMTGIVESNNGTYSGGLQNLFRFHENWRKTTTLPYNFNGSMVCMWVSKIAKNPIEASYTYQPPSRPWGWAKMQPPGLPNIMNIQEFEWKRIDAKDYPGTGF